MDVKVPDYILKKTTQCIHQFRCQSPEWQPCGQIVRKVTAAKLLEGPNQTHRKGECDYRVPFGGKHYCTCPTRIEIYRRYGI